MAQVATIPADKLFQYYLDLDFSLHSKNTPSVFFNMVATIDGITTIYDRSLKIQGGFGGSVDRKLMRVLRAKADCVLNGANTLRIAGTNTIIDYPKLVTYRRGLGKPDHPIAAVLTNSANFDDTTLAGSFFIDEHLQSILFVTIDTPKDKIATIVKQSKKNLAVVTLSNRADNVIALVKTLKEDYGVGNLLVEGGARMNGSLLQNGLGDRFFLTVAPFFGLASPTSKGVTEAITTRGRDNVINASLVSCYAVPQSDVLFQQWQIQHKR